MEHSEQEMKISPTIVRRLRTEQGWSQEQLSAAAGLSLRTIQRVEADGSASLETRTCLAATFGVQPTGLAEESTEDGRVAAIVPTSFARYKVSAGIAAAAFIPAILGVADLLPAGISWLGAISGMLGIALLIYSGLGWYFTGTGYSQSRARRVAKTVFIFAAIFCGFAFFSNGSSSNVAISAQIGVLSLLIYFTLDFLISKRWSQGSTK